ncbi:MAG: S-methyl-5-thioribose-1-phosphate isomerase [Bacillota bacterium]|nr:S-methyl-5-thioribose-1-phosphate isomerase [Bacillota bacterium]
MEILRWEENGLLILDQSELPHNTHFILCTHYQQVVRAIREMRVRGAPAIGVAAAFGFALAAFNFSGIQGPALDQFLSEAAQTLKAARPTAINLNWAIEKMARAYQELRENPLGQIQAGLLEAAWKILREQREQDEKIGSFGVTLIPPRARILTYCNTGALATAGLGTALGIILKAYQQGKEIHVYVPETRPVLQGARLTVWELKQHGIPFTLITDNTAGYLFAQKKVDLVIVGADRIVANGDFANKIGTYGLAVLAAYHRCPFYVAAPLSTFDFNITKGEDIPVEVRSPEEVRNIKGTPITYEDCPVYNPAFDVTPHQLVSAFITEQGIIKPPFRDLVYRYGPSRCSSVPSEGRK